MESKANTVVEYIKELAPERRKAISAVRRIIKKELPAGYKESMQYGMITYSVPLKTYPKGYLGKKDVPLPYIALASQKNHMAVYLMCIYEDKKLDKWFRTEYAKSGKKLDMGKSCLRFKRLEDLDLSMVGKAAGLVPVKKFVEMYERARK